MLKGVTSYTVPKFAAVSHAGTSEKNTAFARTLLVAALWTVTS